MLRGNVCIRRRFEQLKSNPERSRNMAAAARAAKVPPLEASRGSRVVCVFDCRPQRKDASEKMLDVARMSYKQFLCAVRKEFSISVNESFVITTTDRREIDSDVYDELSDGKTLHLLQSVDQELAVATEERIKYVPHFHTIVQSGQYEYYASEGQKALPYAFAELIDNALSATSQNTGNRSIDIRLYFDESQGGPAIVVMDNGRGMTSKELNNWAVYRLSKFNRDDRTFRSDESRYVRPGAVPRSLNSDISYFGVGGKQAVFYIGQCVRIISKPVGSPDVHEFVMSKEDFEQKEKTNKEIYSGIIRNRKPGDHSHVQVEEECYLQSLVLEETGKDSFTTIVITAVQPEHVAYLKQDFSSWTRELAHIYHYYVHGIHGNNNRGARTPETMSNIDIQICLNDRSPRLPRFLNLREIDNDMQTLYINSSVAEFEFKASKDGDAKVEGLLRYHPFLYDRETYPEDPYAAAPDSDEDCIVSHAEGRGKRPIFECFWNGRLIPYSSVNEFDWCTRPKKDSSLLECYNRISGVLFTNDRFQVSTNKLTFMDLELQLRDKETIFTRVLNGQEQRVKINREFTNWLKDCHEKHDKQVKFLGFQDSISRPDVQPKRLQSPWAKYKAIVWDGKTYKAGQQVKMMKTQPHLYGTIVHFLLYGDYENDVYATGGHVKIALEPKELHNEERIIPITKIDRQAKNADIKEFIQHELDKLPDKLRITWPEGNPWQEKAIKPAGTSMGPIQVEILNKKGETMSKLPTQNTSYKKLQIDLKVVWHSAKGDIKTNSHTAVHAKWGYWFRKMENLNKLGSYTLHMQAVLACDGDSLTSEFCGRLLPNYTLNFSIKESSAATFVVGVVPLPVQVGVPFVLPLQFTDEFSHPTPPPPDIKPQLECSSLNLSYEQTTLSGSTFNIQDLRATGTVTNHQDKLHTVKVKIPDLTPDCQSFQISVRPGPPYELVVRPKEEVCIENGTPAGFRVEVHDEFHNITTHSKLIVRCQLFGASDLPADTVDCSNTGSGSLLAKAVQLKNVTTERNLTAKFGIPNQKSVACVERTIRLLPSTRVFRIEVYRKEGDSDDVMVIQNKERINWTAGDTLGSLHFKLYDEGGRQVALTSKQVHNIKVNWAADVKAAELAKGRLPCVCVPTNAHREQFYQVSFQDQHTVDTSFTIVPRPDEPERLRVTLSETTVLMGETLSGTIYVEVIDQYGNKTEALSAERMNAVSVSADNLDESALNFDWQTSTGTMVVTGVRFTGGFPGPRELCFKFQTFEEFVRVKVTAGPPAKITLLEPPEEPLHVMNGHGLDTPFLLQLCDDWGNPVPDQRFIIAIKTLTPQLKVKSPVMSQPVDTEGKASFTLETITATIGEHTLEFRGYFSGSSTVPGPVVKLCVMPDPNNPAKLNVEYNSDSVLKAGDIFPVFKVSVLSEEGGRVKNLSPSSLSMLLWPGLASGARPPTGAMTLKCSKPKEKENDDHFYFRDKEIPVRVGKYMVQFVFAVNKNKPIWSSQIALSVVANKPVKLVPDTPPSTPVVSNSSSLADRTLLETLCLKVMDEHNNPAGLGINGKVILTVTALDGANVDAKHLPHFENKAKSLTYDLVNGETVVTALTLMENSPGTDGAEYALQFRPVLDGPKSKANTIPPYNLPFRFCNDAEKQKLMSAMSRKKDRLSESVEVYREIFETNKQLTAELKGQVQAASGKETQLKQELKKSGVDVAKLTDVASVDSLIAQMTADLERLRNQPRRKCTITDSTKGIQGVLGKIAHLALVKDDDEAKVISWHVLGDMDCVVTTTTTAAKQIYDDTEGRQQVMPLETIFWKPSNRPLPHIRNGQNLFRPLGNPVFVRDLLIFPDHAESCNMVFANILGDTIMVDDLDSANHYRKGVVQSKMQCPTLLTRKGERIRSNGKFGGLQNKAPPIEKLRGQVFGAPLPDEYHSMCKQKELLQQYSIAVENALKVKDDYDLHVEYLQSPEMKRKKQELQQQEKELRDIETELEKEISTPTHTSPGSGKRTLQDEVVESPPLKRARRKSRRLLDS